MNPNVRVLGLTAEPAAAADAVAHAPEVATLDLDTYELPFDVPNGVDCIIYNKILEYLTDPWGLIRRHADALSTDGVMLICIPNADYWRNAERLLCGHAGHEDDRPEPWLHWFNLTTVRNELTRAGLMVCDVTTREPDADEAARFAASLALGLEALGIDPRDYANRAAASHLIWRVRRNPCQRMIVSGNMLKPVGGVSHVRVVYPFQALATDPMVIANVTQTLETSRPDDEVPRIFVLHRPALVGEQGHELLRRLTNAGFLIVTEFDDLPSRFEMMRMGGEIGFLGAHALQTTNMAMAQALHQYNAEIAVFPNAVAKLPEIRNFADPNAITMFFGALNREQDWAPFMPTINAVASMAGNRLRFQVVHDQAFFDALQTPHKTFTPTCDHETYLWILGGSEISFMPLADTPFNRAKSDLKYIEAASCRVAALASSVVYADSIAQGRNGALFRNPAEFHDRLLHLLAMPEHACEMADAARRYVIDERMLAYQVAPRIAWYRSLWARRASLTEARMQRLLLHRGGAQLPR